jgi:hypothetical protein
MTALWTPGDRPEAVIDAVSVPQLLAENCRDPPAVRCAGRKRDPAVIWLIAG